MPSSTNPSTILSGPGRVPNDTVTAAAELFNAGSSQIVATLTDVLTQNLAKISSVSFTANAVTGDSSKSLPFSSSGYFVGSANLKDLFKIVYDSDDNEIFNQTTGLYVSVVSISVPQTGFVSALDITFSTPIPPSTVYKVYYGRQHTLASLPTDFTTNPGIRRAGERVLFPEYNRTSLAPTSVSNNQDYTSTGYPDPMLAQWKAILKGGTSVATYDTARSGAIGFVHLTSLANVLDGTGNDTLKSNIAGAGFLSAYEKDIKSSSFATSPASTVYTKVDSTLNVATTSTTITLNAADFIRVGNSTSFRLGIDMLEVSFTDGKKMVVVPTAFNSGSVRTLDGCKTLGGAASTMPVSSTAKARWIRPNFFAGGAHGKFSTEFHLTGMSVLSPGCITDQPDEEIEHVPPFFSSGTLLTSRGGIDNWNLKALTWGSYTEIGTALSDIGKKTVKGELRGDGSIISRGGRIVGFASERMTTWSISTITSSYTFNPFDNSFLYVDISWSPTNIGAILTMDAGYETEQKDGDQITLLFKLVRTSEHQQISMSWPTSFIFSGDDGNLSSNPARYATGLSIVTSNMVSYVKLVGISAGGSFFITRTDYEVET